MPRMYYVNLAHATTAPPAHAGYTKVESNTSYSRLLHSRISISYIMFTLAFPYPLSRTSQRIPEVRCTIPERAYIRRVIIHLATLRRNPVPFLVLEVVVQHRGRHCYHANANVHHFNTICECSAQRDARNRCRVTLTAQNITRRILRPEYIRCDSTTEIAYTCMRGLEDLNGGDGADLFRSASPSRRPAYIGRRGYYPAYYRQVSSSIR